MEIRLASDFNFGKFKVMFPEIKVWDSDKDVGDIKIDLLVFPGGEDVDMRYYNDQEQIEKYKNIVFSNVARDEREKFILRYALHGDNVNKVLGICRGSQFLNVMFGGTLYEDLGSYGKAHPAMHEISYIRESELGFFRHLNSFHHQAIRSIGDYYGDLNISTHPELIAVEPNTGIPEITSWMKGKVLGVQSHPEYFDEELPEFIMFRDIIIDWANNKLDIVRKRNRNNDYGVKYIIHGEGA